MNGKIVILLLAFAVAIFFHFFNSNKIVLQTRELGNVEKIFNAEKNMTTELILELDELKSGKHIASLVALEMHNFVPEEFQNNIIYVHEPSAMEPDSRSGSGMTRESVDSRSGSGMTSAGKPAYCIVDLFASKAEAKTLNIIIE